MHILFVYLCKEGNACSWMELIACFFWMCWRKIV
jgi:hypothetical protein